MKKVVVTCGYYRSLHTAVLIEKLTKEDFNVVGCINVSLIRWKRLRTYLKWHGYKKLSRIIKNHLGKSNQSLRHSEIKYISEYAQSLGIHPATTVKDIALKNNVVFRTVPDLNCPDSISLLESWKPEIVIYSGGGIIRENFINSSGYGVLNAHGGPLPHFRGMNAAEWAIFYGVRPGITTHMIDTKIDTGPIIHYREIEVMNGDKVEDVRGKAIILHVEMLIEALQQLAYGKQPVPQKKFGGRQFFVMCPEMLNIVNDRLENVSSLRQYNQENIFFHV